MPRTFPLLILVLALLLGCETTPKDEALAEGEEVTISSDELEPISSFILETRRVLVAEFVRIEMTPQFFEERMGFTRDLRYVERTSKRLKDGTRVIELRNLNTDQKTNFQPELLPRVYFGQGLEIRAYNTIRVYLRWPKTKERPLGLHIVGKNQSGDAKLFVTGRLQHESPTITIRSELIWSEFQEEYVHKSSIG